MTTKGPIETAVCVTVSANRAEEYAVVLAASGIPHRLQATDAGWALIVAAGDAVPAVGALTAYDEENRDGASSDASVPPYGETWIGVLITALLVGFFAVTGPPERASIWFDQGSASARQILAGELWRTVTALTLHANVTHVLGNAVACMVLVTAVTWWLGPGVGTWLVLLAGAGGNALTALVHRAPYASIGASTAVFGALGILAALQFVARRQRRVLGRKAWVVIAASLALLGTLGTDPQSDVLAHFFGLLVGGVLGIGAALAWPRPLAESNKRLSALELSYSEGRGKQAVADPASAAAMAELVTEMRNRRENGVRTHGESEGIGPSWAVLLGAVGLIVGILGIGSYVMPRATQTPATNAPAPAVPSGYMLVPAPAPVPAK